MEKPTPSLTRFKVCENCHLNGPLFADGEPMDIRGRKDRQGVTRALCFRCGAAEKLEARERALSNLFTEEDRKMLKEMGILL